MEAKVLGGNSVGRQKCREAKEWEAKKLGGNSVWRQKSQEAIVWEAIVSGGKSYKVLWIHIIDAICR